MSEAAMLYMMLAVGVLFLLYCLGLVVHYERMLKLKDTQIGSLQKDLNAAHGKMMSIDYEKYVEMNIRANAEAQAAWREVERTSEFSDLDIQEPTIDRIRVHGT